MGGEVEEGKEIAPSVTVCFAGKVCFARVGMRDTLRFTTRRVDGKRGAENATRLKRRDEKARARTRAR